MTILTTYGSASGFIIGFLEDVFTPTTNASTSSLDVIAAINADVAEFVNSTLYPNWFVQWNMQIYCGSFYIPAQTFQSPIDSTNAWIAELIGSSTKTNKVFGNNICQSLGVYSSWGNKGGNSYPNFDYLPRTPNPADQIYFLAGSTIHADTVYILAQNASLSGMIYRIIYSVYAEESPAGYFVNMPDIFS